MSDSLDDLVAINARLGEIDSALFNLSTDAVAERTALETERASLKERAAAFAVDLDTGRPTDDLVAEVASLRERLAEIDASRIDFVSQAGGGDSSLGDGLGTGTINQAIEHAQGADELNDRIRHLTSILSDRGVDS